MTNSDTQLSSAAWILIGLGNQPALLEMADGLLALTTREGRVFEVPVADLTNVTFPWYYFGGGLKLTAAGANYRISFVRPNGAEMLTARLLESFGANTLALLTVGQKIADIARGRRAGKAWRKALQG
jgi:hypothetical protein